MCELLVKIILPHFVRKTPGAQGAHHFQGPGKQTDVGVIYQIMHYTYVCVYVYMYIYILYIYILHIYYVYIYVCIYIYMLYIHRYRYYLKPPSRETAAQIARGKPIFLRSLRILSTKSPVCPDTSLICSA